MLHQTAANVYLCQVPVIVPDESVQLISLQNTWQAALFDMFWGGADRLSSVVGI